MRKIFYFFVLFLISSSLFGQGKKAIKLFKKGENKMSERKYVGAIVDFTEAVSRDSTFADAYLQRGLAFYNMGEYVSAIRDFNRCIRHNPVEILAYVNGIEACFLSKNYEKGLNFAHLLGENIPSNIGVSYYQKARLFVAMGKSKDAILHYQNAIDNSLPMEDDELIKLCKKEISKLDKK